MSLYAKRIAGVVAVWFALSLAAAALHLYETGPGQPPLAFGLAALTPIVLFLAWFSRSPKFREFALSLNPRVLTLVQSWRLAGFVFLVLAEYRILPRIFALPAGCGRYRHWRHRLSGSAAAGNRPTPPRLHPVAGAGNHGSGHGRHSGCNGAHDRSSGSSHQRDDRASTEPDSDVRRAAVPHPARDLYCAGRPVAGAAVSGPSQSAIPPWRYKSGRSDHLRKSRCA